MQMRSLECALLHDRESSPDGAKDMLLTVIAPPNDGIDLPSLRNAITYHVPHDGGPIEEITSGLLAAIIAHAPTVHEDLGDEHYRKRWKNKAAEVSANVSEDFIGKIRSITSSSVYQVLVLESLGGQESFVQQILAFMYHNRLLGGSDAVVAKGFVASSAAILSMFSQKLYAFPDTRFGFHAGGSSVSDIHDSNLTVRDRAKLETFIHTLKSQSIAADIELLVRRLGEGRRQEITALFSSDGKININAEVIFNSSQLLPHTNICPKDSTPMSEIFTTYPAFKDHVHLLPENHYLRKFI